MAKKIEWFHYIQPKKGEYAIHEFLDALQPSQYDLCIKTYKIHIHINTQTGEIVH